VAKHVLSAAVGGVEGSRLEGSFEAPVRQAHRLLRMSGNDYAQKDKPSANLKRDAVSAQARSFRLNTLPNEKAPAIAGEGFLPPEW
jgi:hypothetical protein